MNEGPIFLVEDNADDETLVIRALAKAGIRNEIIVARDGAEALDRLFGDEEFCPAIILLDLKLPKVDGLEVLKRLRANERTRLFPVAILTSSDEQEDILRSYKLGVNSYVRKPVEFGRFAETVGQLGLYWLLVNEKPPGGADHGG
jgi:two-component system response regulator